MIEPIITKAVNAAIDKSGQGAHLAGMDKTLTLVLTDVGLTLHLCKTATPNATLHVILQDKPADLRIAAPLKSILAYLRAKHTKGTENAQTTPPPADWHLEGNPHVLLQYRALLQGMDIEGLIAPYVPYEVVRVGQSVVTKLRDEWAFHAEKRRYRPSA